MSEKIVTLKNLEEITQVSMDTLYVYLRGFRFTKFERSEKIDNYRKIVYCFNKEFLDTLTEFLKIKRKHKAIERLKNYYNKEVKWNYD